MDIETETPVPGRNETPIESLEAITRASRDLPIHDPTLDRDLSLRLTEELHEGESVALEFEDGQTLALEARDGLHWAGTLTRHQLEVPFDVIRLPGRVREAGIRGQRIPPHAAKASPEPLWLFPLAWEDRPARSIHLPEDERLRHHTVQSSRWVDVPRQVRVLLPEGYEQNPTRRYPVVVALDGQNLFDARNTLGGVSWNLHRILEQLSEQGVPPFLLVAVDHGERARADEYCPFTADPEGHLGFEEGEAGGRARDHLEFLLHEVDPSIRRHYRVQPGPMALMGSSYGGLFSLWTSVAYPAAYRAVASLSPSVWWSHAAILQQELGVGPRPRIYMDMGSSEDGTCVWEYHATRRMLKRHGWLDDIDLETHLVEGAAHHEAAWSARAADALRFLVSEPRERRQRASN